jgi:hypothetical protein
MQPDTVVAHIGAPTAAAYHRAETILEQIPDELLKRARDANAVLPLIVGLLLSSDPDVRASQHRMLMSHNPALGHKQLLQRRRLFHDFCGSG